MSDFSESSEATQQRIERLEKQSRRLRRAIIALSALSLITILAFAAVGFGDGMLRMLGIMSVRTLEVRDENGKVHAVLTATTKQSWLEFLAPDGHSSLLTLGTENRGPYVCLTRKDIGSLQFTLYDNGPYASFFDEKGTERLGLGMTRNADEGSFAALFLYDANGKDRLTASALDWGPVICLRDPAQVSRIRIFQHEDSAGFALYDRPKVPRAVLSFDQGTAGLGFFDNTGAQRWHSGQY